MRISGNVFLVTGGGNGIGREVVLALRARGARVAAVDLSLDGLSETARLVGEDVRLTTHVPDVTDWDAVERVVADVVAAHGQLDGVLNVAGIIQPFVPVKDLERAVFEKVMAVNFWGVVNVTTAALPVLLTRPAASITNISSMGSFAAVPGQTAYGASKAAVTQFTAGLWAELRDTPVEVTVVMPGGVSTGIATHSGAERPGQDASDSPVDLTTPAEAARQIVAGTEKGSYRVVIGKDARLLDVLSRAMPRRANQFLARRMSSLLD
ncbi:SDR family oxidoreductase [Nocardioides sp. zg-DK7169]|uniref:SDR family NAD(P)-dependent oxidoreductase n=1 Tax=Nocardioides sp. zg-DK7169 TaxID=2736600 RepID=UPI00155205C1|nr:SDR family oxidoreductase [Nocardioides sp. zg-DK7169]NPC96370.1 SDR family oxidoreductase [Nocardioides sp. zg-DK7169]